MHPTHSLISRSVLDRRISTRRRPALLAAPLGFALAAAGGYRGLRPAHAASGASDAPVFDQTRPVPRGLGPGDLAQVRGARPVAMWSEAAGIEAGIDPIHIVDGVMQDPRDPFLVSWYEESAGLGERGNSLYAGHVNWASVGASVFANLSGLSEGDEIVLTGDDGEIYTFEVQWQETVEVATVTPDEMKDLVGQTRKESVTLITCGGEFDHATGQYLSRTVVRGERVRP